MKLERNALKALIKESLNEMKSTKVGTEGDLEEGLMDFVPGSSARKMKQALAAQGGDKSDMESTKGLMAKFEAELLKFKSGFGAAVTKQIKRLTSPDLQAEAAIVLIKTMDIPLAPIYTRLKNKFEKLDVKTSKDQPTDSAQAAPAAPSSSSVTELPPAQG